MAKLTKAHSKITADELLQLGWVLRTEFRTAPDQEPYEYLFEWLSDEAPRYPRTSAGGTAGAGVAQIIAVASNAAVVQLPERRYPGIVIQGDTLSSLCDSANEVAIALKHLTITNDTACAMQDLLDSLVSRLLLYQDALTNAGMDLPFAPRRTEADFIRLDCGHDG